MKILSAIDGSDFSKVAIHELIKMTLSSNSEIHIINVYELPKTTGLGLHTMGGKIGNYIEEIRSNAQKLGNKIVSEAFDKIKAENKALTITTSVVSGLPKSTIYEKAEDWGCRFNRSRLSGSRCTFTLSIGLCIPIFDHKCQMFSTDCKR